MDGEAAVAEDEPQVAPAQPVVVGAGQADVRHREVRALEGGAAAHVRPLLQVVQPEERAVGGAPVDGLDPPHRGGRGIDRAVDVAHVPAAGAVPREGRMVVGKARQREPLRGGRVAPADTAPRVLVGDDLVEGLADPERRAVAVAPHRALDAERGGGDQGERGRGERGARRLGGGTGGEGQRQDGRRPGPRHAPAAHGARSMASRIASRIASAVSVSPRRSSPSAAPARSRASRFCPSFHFPSSRVMRTSRPTMAPSICCM